MADLLQSLLTPWPAHTHPKHRTEANMFGSSSSSSSRQPNPIPTPASGLQDGSDTDHIFVDADEYLQGIPTSTPGSTTSRDEPSKVMPAIQPVQIGQSRSSMHSVAFHRLAQEKRIPATFEFKEPTPQQFSVTLTLDGRRVVEEPGPWPSKKAAKEAACEKGYQVLTGMQGIATPTNIENWVGILQEYYDSRDHASPRPTYTDFAVGHLFACELVIDKRASVPFGGRYTTFPSKKAAKTKAAREAVEWLTANNFMGPQGPPTKKKRKSGSISQAAPESGMTVEIKRTANFAQKVSELCPMIGLPPPEYRLLPDPKFESMYSGAAFFNDPIIPHEPIGGVRNVYGKKKAKEEIAKGVLAFLKEWTGSHGVELKEKE